jgi:hypothetical protein
VDGGPERKRLDPPFSQQPSGQLDNTDQAIVFIDIKEEFTTSDRPATALFAESKAVKAAPLAASPRLTPSWRRPCA